MAEPRKPSRPDPGLQARIDQCDAEVGNFANNIGYYYWQLVHRWGVPQQWAAQMAFVYQDRLQSGAIEAAAQRRLPEPEMVLKRAEINEKEV